MKLLFKQKVFSWFDTYDIFDAQNNVVFTVKGQISWGHLLNIFDASGNQLGAVKEKIFTFLPKFELYLNDRYIGEISKELTFFKDKFNIDFNGWHVTGDIWDYTYQILSPSGSTIAMVNKQWLTWGDTYEIDVADSNDTLYALMVVLAIDAAKCSSGD